MLLTLFDVSGETKQWNPPQAGHHRQHQEDEQGLRSRAKGVDHKDVQRLAVQPLLGGSKNALLEDGCQCWEEHGGHKYAGIQWVHLQGHMLINLSEYACDSQSNSGYACIYSN